MYVLLFLINTQTMYLNDNLHVTVYDVRHNIMLCNRTLIRI